MLDDRKCVLFVDDDADVRKTAELLLRKRGFAFLGAAAPEEALSLLVSSKVDVILLDLNFSRAQTSGQEGLNCLRDILRHDPQSDVIVVTGHSGLNIAVQALRAGARDFIMKPWNNERLVEAIEGTLALQKPSDVPEADPALMVGASEAIQQIKRTVDRLSPLTVPVLIRGESGAGKSLTALCIHRRSGRANLTHIDASTLTPAGLDELSNSTLILENIDRLAEGMASVVLSWLGRGARQNCRLVATTTRGRGDLGLDRGLTYAISTVDIEVPPLRERVQDIGYLAEHFIRVTCHQYGFGLKKLSPAARAHLSSHSWPDNVHALKHSVERAVIMGEDTILDPADLAIEDSLFGEVAAEKPKLAESEKVLIEEALQRNNFNVSAAAIELGLTRPALYRRMSKYGL